MPGAIIFDLDGVIIDSEGLQYKAYAQVLAPFGVTVSEQEYAAHWTAAGQGPEYAVRRYGLALQPDELRRRKHPVYHAILRAEVALMPGVLDALTRLQAHFPLALATNSNRADVDFVVDHFALRRFFTAVVTREDYARAKPEPDAFVTAASRLGVATSACVVIEDSARGTRAAARAGSVVVAVPNAFTRDNDFTVAAKVLGSLDELTVELVEQLLTEV